MVFTELRNKKRKNQQGFSLFELAMYLGIATVLVAGITTVYQVTDTSRKISSTIRQLTSVQEAVRSLYASQSNYGDLNSSIIIGAKAVPRDMIVNSDLKHAFGQAIYVGPGIKETEGHNTTSSSGVGTEDNLFSVTFTNLPVAACTKLSTLSFTNSQQGIKIGANPRVEVTASPSDAVEKCTVAGGTNVTWNFY